LERKLAAFELHDRLRVPLYFGLSDTEGQILKIDFPARAVEHVREIPETDYYSLMTPSWQIARVLDGAITWEEFALTFRVRLNRKPDVYQTLIQGFLLLEPEDMNWFCRRLLEIEQNRERVIVEAGGLRYSIDRYCPHQGGDLSQGWADDGKYWTCPRHRWQFALEEGGKCITGDGSIHAVCLEND
jgi:UDP-MurNAc hydroxylase